MGTSNHPMRWLALLLLGLAACGREAPGPTAAAEAVDAAEALGALGRVPCALDEEGLRLWWIDEGLTPLVRAREAARGGDDAVRAVGRDEVVRRARRARVVLVGDLHDHDAIRRAFGDLVLELADPEALAGGRVAIVLEAVRADASAPVLGLTDAVRRGDREALLASLRAQWPWPVEAYAEALLDPRLRAVTVFGGGAAKLGAVPDATVEDAARRPIPQIADWEDVKYGVGFGATNYAAAGAVRAWLEGGEGRQAFVLCGAAHLVREGEPRGGIAGLLAGGGVDPLVVLPFLPSLEAALWRRFGNAAERTWYELPGGILRSPSVAAADLVAMVPGPAAATPGEAADPGPR